MAGAETCSTETTGTVSPTVTPIPDVTVEIQGPIADKCSSETGTFSFPAKVYNLGGSTGTMTVTATWGAAPGEACSVSPNTAGEHAGSFLLLQSIRVAADRLQAVVQWMPSAIAVRTRMLVQWRT